MATINIRGYDVNFPYPVPYELQKDYMEKVLRCLDEKTHAVLESPTGTGKTLCLFAPVTAWAKVKKSQVHFVASQADDCSNIKYEKNDSQSTWGSKKKSKIWYTSRTHSQIAQTVSEVRKCNIEGLIVRVMGARDQLCINRTVLEEKDSYIKTIKCKELVKNKQCRYYNSLNYEKNFPKYYPSGQVLDIEDLVNVGKTNGVCPYFLAKKASETADIVLLPYNYIIDEDSREANSIYLHSDVIIFDEGHNIPNTCEESFEFTFNALDIALGIRNVKELMLNLSKLADSTTEDNEIDVQTHASNAILLMTVLQKLESELETLPTSNDLLPVSALFEFFEKVGINERTSLQLLDGIKQFKNDSSLLTLSGSTLETFKLLEKMMNAIFGPTVKSFDNETVKRSFKCGVTIDSERVNNMKKLSLYCFNPSFGIRHLLRLGVQSIIITSGTLSPLKTFIYELALPNPVTLENGHIARKCQVPFVILGTGVNNVRMDGAYKNRNDPQYMFSLGMTLTNLISSIPDGILLLFSSYAMMKSLKEAWESDTGIWARLNALKRVFVEPRDKDEFINSIENYKRAIDAGNGALLMGVLRGKISEGMDFKDQYCRGVFIIGVPFPPVQDPRVQGKQKYSESLTILNPVTKLEEKLYNNNFMSVEAMKATNQAIGRVIRHRHDYGVIILVDYRFAWPRLFSNISSWLRGDSPTVRNFPETKKLIRDFFKNVNQGKLGFEEIRCQRVDSNGCPIASYVSYEEYDYKKQASQPVAWIGGEKSQEVKRTKSRGHSNIEYVDEDVSQNLVSIYKNLNSVTFTTEDLNSESKNSGSLLDVLESSRSSSVGYREYDKNNASTSEPGKRKHEDANDSTQISPSLLHFPEPQHKHKKFPRLKVRPLTCIDDEEPEVQDAAPSKEEQEENLKIKLINYYRKVKQNLSKENDQKFKNISCKYMKGEVALNTVIEFMDEVFLVSGNKNLFSGFHICIKGKDKNEWMKACKMRAVDFVLAESP